ncbi:MAG TPA: hypothetical protein VK699_09420 [Terriglobales bacterium]|jgi:hypothetical protein|nr:hypothetical protein [Terriglobales bacterium]
MDSLETSILDFVADASGVRRDKLSLTTRLSQDLGIEGLDAEELFKAFGICRESKIADYHSGIGRSR